MTEPSEPSGPTVPTKPTESTDMTDMRDTDKSVLGATPYDKLRDARLAQALRHMPDAHMQASAEARLAILKHAQAAVAGSDARASPTEGQSSQSRPWLQWLLGETGNKRASHTAWGGALASVLVASFITLMWYGQPVPDANPEGLPQGVPATQQEVTASQPAKEIAAAASMATKTAPLPAPKTPAVSPEAQKKQEMQPSLAAPPSPPPHFRKDLAAEAAKPATPANLPAPPPPLRAITEPPPAAPAPAPAALAERAAMTDIPAPAVAAAAPLALAKSQAADSALATPNTAGAKASLPAATAALGGAQRSRAESLPAFSATITQHGKTTRMVATQAAALLGALRALPYETSGDGLHDTTEGPVFTVQSSQGEMWTVAPHRVKFRHAPLSLEAKQKPHGTVSAITDAQWQELRGMAQAAP